MRDRTPKTASPAPVVVAPSADKIAQLRALADKIENHRSDLDDYLNEYARLLTPAGVPMVNIRQMIDARGVCICQSSLFAIGAQVQALELEEKQRGAIPEE